MARTDGVRPHKSGEPNVWEVDSSGSYMPDGTKAPRRMWVFHGTRAEAARYRSTMVAKLISGRVVSQRGKEATPTPSVTDEITFEAYAETYYLPAFAALLTGVPGSYKARRRHLRQHVFPLIGDLPLKEAVLPAAYLRLVTYLRVHAGLKKNSSRNNILTAYGAVMNHAADGNRKMRSPTNRPILDWRGLPEKFPKEKRSSKRLEEDQWDLLFAATHSMPQKYGSADYWYVLVGLGFFLGLRSGEACGAKWTDIDWEHRKINVIRQVSTTEDTIVDHTKGRQGEQEDTWLDIEQSLFEALGRLRTEQTAEYILGGRRQGRNAEKGYLRSSNLGHRMRLITTKAWGRDRASEHYHILRHTCASRIVEVRSLKAASMFLRHSAVDITARFYVHESAREMESMGQALAIKPSKVAPLRVLEGGKS